MDSSRAEGVVKIALVVFAIVEAALMALMFLIAFAALLAGPLPGAVALILTGLCAWLIGSVIVFLWRES